MAGVFAAHDRARFEIFGFSDTPDDRSERLAVEAGCDHFRTLRSLDAVAAAERIATDELDILVVLDALAAEARPEIAFLRPAPIQVSYRSSATSGADHFDYFLTDAIASPPGSEAHFSERLLYLPECFLVADISLPTPTRTPTRAECGLPGEGFVFCSFSRPHEIDPTIFDVWMRLIAAVPGSVLWLAGKYPEVRKNLVREAEARGVSAERLVFADQQPHAAHLARLGQADLVLDTPLVNAIAAAVDALGAGVPFLTLPGV